MKAGSLFSYDVIKLNLWNVSSHSQDMMKQLYHIQNGAISEAPNIRGFRRDGKIQLSFL